MHTLRSEGPSLFDMPNVKHGGREGGEMLREWCGGSQLPSRVKPPQWQHKYLVHYQQQQKMTTFTGFKMAFLVSFELQVTNITQLSAISSR